MKANDSRVLVAVGIDKLREIQIITGDLERLLQGINFDVVHAIRHARQLIQNQHYAALIIDGALPEIEGDIKPVGIDFAKNIAHKVGQYKIFLMIDGYSQWAHKLRREGFAWIYETNSNPDGKSFKAVDQLVEDIGQFLRYDRTGFWPIN